MQWGSQTKYGSYTTLHIIGTLEFLSQAFFAVFEKYRVVELPRFRCDNSWNMKQKNVLFYYREKISHSPDTINKFVWKQFL
jgi:hypothetical protein